MTAESRVRLVSISLLIAFALAAGRAHARGQPDEHTVFLPVVMAQPPSPLDVIHSGEGTYYTEANGDGNCMFGPSPEDLMVAAMNHTDYADAALCGAYIEVSGPSGKVTVRVVDRCPECPQGDVDLSPQAFSQIAALILGRVPITWRLLSPDISGPIRYQFKDGSNPWWTAVQIRNHRHPVARVEYLDSAGQFVEAPRQPYNYFVAEHGMGPGPYSFRVTDIFGHVLTDHDIPLAVGAEVTGSGQFPKEP
ncbi:MAG: hypothetical protein M1546_17575 [Chloroflexi bacterium]|nr:hypothetical protein [Chloroflexota bacterium]